MDLSLLPQLVLDLLVEHISEEDILHCSMVCVGWREAFNRDHYWKALCVRYPDSLFDYLKDKPCQVEPRFQVCVGGNSTLSEPCDWKMNYMRARHLEWNREHGRYKVHEVKLPERFFKEEYIVTGSGGDLVCFYGGDNRFELWNIEHEPFLWARFKPATSFSFSMISLLYITKTRQTLAILQHNILQVFKLSGTDFILDYGRLVDKPEEDYHCICGPVNFIRTKYRNEFQLTAQAFDNLFFGVYIDDARQVLLCVWNLETGKKEKQVQLNDEDSTLIVFSIISVHMSFKPKAETIVVAVSCDRRDDDSYFTTMISPIFKYNLATEEKLCFPNFKHLRCILNETLVVTYSRTWISSGGPNDQGLYTDEPAKYSKEIKFWDISTNKPIVVKSISNKSCYDYCIHEPYFMFHTCSDDVMTVHTKTLETLGSFKVAFDQKRSYNKIHILFNNMLVISTLDTSLVWDWKKQIELYRFPTSDNIDSTIYKNEYFTHIFMSYVGGIIDNWCDILYIYHFW